MSSGNGVADQVGALERALAESEARAERLEALVEASQLINSTLNLDEVLQRILRTATDYTRADRGTIYLVDRERGDLWSKVIQTDTASLTISQTGTVLEIRLPLGAGIAGHVGATGEVIALADAYDDPRFNPAVDRSSGYRTRAMLCTPIRDRSSEIVGVFQILNKPDGPFTPADVLFLDSLSTHASIAIDNARLYGQAREMKKLEEEMLLAREIQGRLLPASLPTVPGYAFAANHQPARQVGGDYYDCLARPGDSFFVAIGDVSGKGVPASLLMANLQACFHAQAGLALSTDEMSRRLNTLLHQVTPWGKFITFFCAALDPATHTLRFTNAGHNPPMLRRRDGSIEELSTGGIMLGILPDQPFIEGEITLEPGEALVMFTDGVTEAFNVAEEEYGEDRLRDVLRRCPDADATGLMETILDEVSTFSGDAPQSDDITLFILSRSS